MASNLGANFVLGQRWAQSTINPDGCLNEGMIGAWAASLLTDADWVPTLVNTTHDDLDACQYRQTLGPGSYGIDILFTGGPDCGIIEWWANAILQGPTQDTYLAVAAKILYQNTFVLVQPSSDVTMKLRVNGKNAASTNHYCRISGLWISRYI